VDRVGHSPSVAAVVVETHDVTQLGAVVARRAARARHTAPASPCRSCRKRSSPRRAPMSTDNSGTSYTLAPTARTAKAS
jgi:hypothetical protein